MILGWLSKIKSFALGSPESDLCFFGFGSLVEGGPPHRRRGSARAEERR